MNSIDLNNFDFHSDLIDFLPLLITKSTLTFILVSIYIPPDIPLPIYKAFFTALLDFEILYTHPLVIIDDFNRHSTTTDSKVIILKHFCSSIGLKQWNVITNSNNKMLDLGWSNEVCHITRANFPLDPEDQEGHQFITSFKLLHQCIDIFNWVSIMMITLVNHLKQFSIIVGLIYLVYMCIYLQ